LTLLTAIVDRLKLLQTLPQVGHNGSCFLSIGGAKVIIQLFYKITICQKLHEWDYYANISEETFTLFFHLEMFQNV
jgi:hypothetical protein